MGLIEDAGLPPSRDFVIESIPRPLSGEARSAQHFVELREARLRGTGDDLFLRLIAAMDPTTDWRPEATRQLQAIEDKMRRYRQSVAFFIDHMQAESIAGGNDRVTDIFHDHGAFSADGWEMQIPGDRLEQLELRITYNGNTPCGPTHPFHLWFEAQVKRPDEVIQRNYNLQRRGTGKQQLIVPLDHVTLQLISA